MNFEGELSVGDHVQALTPLLCLCESSNTNAARGIERSTAHPQLAGDHTSAKCSTCPLTSLAESQARPVQLSLSPRLWLQPPSTAHDAGTGGLRVCDDAQPSRGLERAARLLLNTMVSS